MAKQTREQLGVKPGDKIAIKGKVSFSKIDKLIEGNDLIKENERRIKHGMITADKGFRSITIEEPEIVKGEGTPLAQFHGQSVYTQKSTGKQMLNLESKSLFPPQYGHMQDGVVVEIEDPKRNPAQGQVVYLLVEAYKVKGFNNMGSTFNAIIFEEGPIKFFEGTNALEGFGEIMDMPVETLPQEQPKAVEKTEEPAGKGFAEAPTANPFGSAPANPFGIQDSDIPSNSGERVDNPFA